MPYATRFWSIDRPDARGPYIMKYMSVEWKATHVQLSGTACKYVRACEGYMLHASRVLRCPPNSGVFGTGASRHHEHDPSWTAAVVC